MKAAVARTTRGGGVDCRPPTLGARIKASIDPLGLKRDAPTITARAGDRGGIVGSTIGDEKRSPRSFELRTALSVAKLCHAIGRHAQGPSFCAPSFDRGARFGNRGATRKRLNSSILRRSGTTASSWLCLQRCTGLRLLVVPLAPFAVVNCNGYF